MSGEKFQFARGNLGKLLSIPRYALGAVHAKTVRRDPSLWVVGSAFGPTDGALALVRAAADLPRPPRVVWLSGSAAETAAARAAGLGEVVDRDSSAGYRLTLGAGAAIVTHGFGDVNRYGVSGAVIVQLWHGSPLKKLHADSPAALSVGALGRIPGATSLMAALYRRGTSRISLLPVASQAYVPSMCSAFALTPAQVRPLGEPRTDVLFRGPEAERRARARALLERHLGPLGERRVILYAPTWRDGEPDPAVPSPAQWAALDEYLEASDSVLAVRPHPLGIGAYRHRSPRVKLLTGEQQPESMPLLWGVDVLVTDYSSMIVDYAVTGGQLVCLAPDLEHYAATRGLYVDYADLSGGSWETTWDGVIARLRVLAEDPDEAARAAAHSRRLAAELHAHTDGRNAERVAAATADLVAARFG